MGQYGCVTWDKQSKWSICPHIGETEYKIAILQEKARSEWNIQQYKDSIKYLTGLNVVEPSEGTFVPHHFVFHHHILDLLHHMRSPSDNTRL